GRNLRPGIAGLATLGFITNNLVRAGNTIGQAIQQKNQRAGDSAFAEFSANMQPTMANLHGLEARRALDVANLGETAINQQISSTAKGLNPWSRAAFQDKAVRWKATEMKGLQYKQADAGVQVAELNRDAEKDSSLEAIPRGIYGDDDLVMATMEIYGVRFMSPVEDDIVVEGIPDADDDTAGDNYRAEQFGIFGETVVRELVRVGRAELGNRWLNEHRGDISAKQLRKIDDFLKGPTDANRQTKLSDGIYAEHATWK
ncbi:unnamed protein product, partial [marine sediment metagenome]